MVTASDAKAFARELFNSTPQLRRFALAPDGKLHQLAFPFPFEVHAGVAAHALVVGMGPYGKRRAEEALGTAVGPAAPLLAVTFDYTKALAAMGQQLVPDIDSDVPPDAGLIGERVGVVLGAFMMNGRWEFVLEPSDHGLALRFAEDRK
jgi:hypothetical protein